MNPAPPVTCAVSLALWLTAFAGLRALGLAPWQAAVAGAGVAWVVNYD